MVDQIGSGGAARSALDALLRQMQEKKAELAGLDAPAQPESSFAEIVQKGISEVDASVKSTDALPAELLRGELDFHEVAARIKESELTFDFSMQVRNKFIEAYREIMRMNV